MVEDSCYAARLPRLAEGEKVSTIFVVGRVSLQGDGTLIVFVLPKGCQLIRGFVPRENLYRFDQVDAARPVTTLVDPEVYVAVGVTNTRSATSFLLWPRLSLLSKEKLFGRDRDLDHNLPDVQTTLALTFRSARG